MDLFWMGLFVNKLCLTQNRKNLKPCRGFKSFRSLAVVIQFLKKCIFGSSNPSTQRKIENGSMEIRKNLWTKKAEKSFEISAFLVFSRSDLNRPKDLAGTEGLARLRSERWREETVPRTLSLHAPFESLLFQQKQKTIGMANAIPIVLAGAQGLEPWTCSFGDCRSTN